MTVPGDFSVGALHGWSGVLTGIFGSLLSLLSGWQDLRRRFSLGSVFWFFIALLFAGGVIWLGIGARIWMGALMGAAVFCSEAWLIQRWWRRGHSARG